MSKIPGIDHSSLKNICLAPFEALESLGVVSRQTVKGSSYTLIEKGVSTVVDNPDREDRYIFIDRGASVLAVAHLDTVQNSDHYFVQKLGSKNGVGGKYYIFNCQLDDRLGVYLLLEYLPQIVGQDRYDILLTDGEERASSTARHFHSDKQYNWMFMFDRATQYNGEVDSVTYEYTDHKLTKLVESYGWKHSRGSYSCIRELEHLGCKGINFGAGYQDNHGLLSHAIVEDIQFSASCFQRFFQDNAEVSMPHTKQPVWNRDDDDWEKDANGVYRFWNKKKKKGKKDQPKVCDRCDSPIDGVNDLFDVWTNGVKSTRCVTCLQYSDQDVAGGEGYWY